jgi:hypothetical protein
MLENLPRFREKVDAQGQSVEAFRAQLEQQIRSLDKELAGRR